MRTVRLGLGAAVLAAVLLTSGAASAAPTVGVGGEAGHAAGAGWFAEGANQLVFVDAIGATGADTEPFAGSFGEIDLASFACESDEVVIRFYSPAGGSYDSSPLDHAVINASSYSVVVVRVPNCQEFDLDHMTISDPAPVDIAAQATITATGDYTPYDGGGLGWGLPCVFGDGEAGLYREAAGQLSLSGPAAAGLGLPALTSAGGALSAGADGGGFVGDDSCFGQTAELRGQRGRRAQRRAFARLARAAYAFDQ